MKCPRCLNENPAYFYQRNGQYYCRKCISFKNSTSTIQTHYPLSHVDYTLKYELTSKQKEISTHLIERYKNHQNTILKAVCGAGKTEIVYGVMKYALSKGDKVCFAIPRKELVIELSRRIKSQFREVEPVVVYGGHNQIIDGQLIICTTHQLYRYTHCFDLLILDEYDAFPYYHNDVLENMLKRSIKGHWIFMSATLQSGDENLIRRYHNQPIPVPKCYVCGKLMMLLVVKRLKHYQKTRQPVFLFVPSITMTKKVAKQLEMFRIRCSVASSCTKDIHARLDDLKKHQIDVIVCTTVLERGMTLKDVQVIVIHGEHPVFNKETLIQIAGRVGRVMPCTLGDVTIYASRKTKAIKECIAQLEKDNV